MDAHICVVTSAKFYLLSIIEIDNMQMLLALVFLLLLLLCVQLETFNDDVILLRLLNVEYLMVPLSVLQHILELRFAKLTVKCFPSVRSNMGRYLFILISAQPLP